MQASYPMETSSPSSKLDAHTVRKPNNTPEKKNLNYPNVDTGREKRNNHEMQYKQLCDYKIQLYSSRFSFFGGKGSGLTNFCTTN